MLPIEVDVAEVQSLIKQGEDFLFLDCREPEEREIATIAATHHIPIGQTVERQNELDDFREKRIVVHCHHGVRSLQVAQYLRSQGFDQVQSMAGGIDAWSQKIDSSIPVY